MTGSGEREFRLCEYFRRPKDSSIDSVCGMANRQCLPGGSDGVVLPFKALQDLSRRTVGSAAMEDRVRCILYGELDLLSSRLSSQKRYDDERGIQPGRPCENTSSTTQQGSGADGKQESPRVYVSANERQHLFIVHQFLRQPSESGRVVIWGPGLALTNNGMLMPAFSLRHLSGTCIRCAAPAQ